MSDASHESHIRIELLGSFHISVGDEELATGAMGTRATELVQLLALADSHSLAREQAIDALWPHLAADAGGANLRKAAHHVRKALGDPEAIVLRGGRVQLFPGRPTSTDVEGFVAAAGAALEGGDPERCQGGAAAYSGDLLPEARYQEWAAEPRERLRSLQLELLRCGGEWERVVEADPAEEDAYVELMRRELASGSRAGAIRWFGRLRTALRRDLGLVPGPAAVALYEECIAGLSAEQPEIVGRQLELALATAVLQSDAGAGMVALQGSAGIGKTALCAELGQLAGAEGWLVAGATAAEEDGPYAPLIEVAQTLLGQDPDLLTAVGAASRVALAELTPAAAPAPRLEGPLTRHRVVGAIRRLLRTASRGAPVLLVIDDAHLADAATIDAIGHLGSGEGRVVVVVAFRPEGAPPELTRVVARLGRGVGAEVIDLEPLAPEESRSLIDMAAAGPREPVVIERIVDLAGGNPFLVLELARSAVAGVPALVRNASDAITARLVDLDEQTCAGLRRLALAGGELGGNMAVALTGTGEGDTNTLLDAALRSGVLVVSDVGYRFRHDLVRQALMEGIPPHARVSIHGETAARLAEAEAPPGLVAARWLDAGRPDEARTWLLAAARDAIRLGAFADALHQLELVLEHQPADAEALRLRAEAMDARGEATAPAAYASAISASEGPMREELRAKRALATIKLGDPEAGIELLEGIEPTTLDGRLAHALAHAGAAALGFADPAMGTAMAAQARKLALEADDPGAVTVASWAHAAAAHARGDLRESVRTDLGETQGLGRLAVSLFDGQLCMTQRLLYGARPYDDVIAFADLLAAEADRLNTLRGKAFAVTIRGEARLLSGQLGEAEADLAAGAELHRGIGAPTGEAFALQRRAEVALHTFDYARADALLEQALDIARDSAVGFHLFDRIYGARIAAARSPEAAVAALEEAEEAVRGPNETCPTCRITLAAPAAVAAARAGDLERAEQWRAATEYLAHVVMRLPGWDAAFAEVEGHCATAVGNKGAAHEHFAAAAALFERAGQPLDQSRCRALAAAG